MSYQKLSSQPTHLALVPTCVEMEAPRGANPDDKYFLVEIWKEEFEKQESLVEPTKDYRIYLQLELPKRTVEQGSYYVQLDTSQFFYNPPGPIVKRLVFYPMPPRFWLELTIHRHGKLDGLPSWAHIRDDDEILVHLRRPKFGGEEGELEPLFEDERYPPIEVRSAAPLGRRRTIIRKVTNGLRRVVGK